MHKAHFKDIWFSRVPDAVKSSLSWLMATGQTIRWATQQAVLRELVQNGTITGSPEAATPSAGADIGCGGGRYLIDIVAPLTHTAVGIDPNPRSIRIAEARIERAGLSHRVRAIPGSAENLPLSAESMDLIICTEVLEHLSEPGKGLKEIHRILRPGGRAVLSIPIPPDPYPNAEHVQPELTPSALECILAEIGFTVLCRRTCMFVISRTAIWLTSVLRTPLPVVPLCRLEQALAGIIRWPRPYDLVCVVAKSVP